MTPPADLSPAAALLRRQIKWLLLLRVSTLSLLLGVIALLQISLTNLVIAPLPHILIFISAVYIFSIISSLILNHCRDYRLFALFQITMDSIMIGTIVYFSGGSHSIFTFLYFFPVISAGMLLFKSGGLLIATFNLINYALVLSTEYSGPGQILPHSLHMFSRLPDLFWQNITIYGLSFYIVAILSSFLAQRQRHTEDILKQTSQNFDRITLLYKQIFADISSGIITVDNLGIITSFNPAAAQITGYQPLEIIGRPISRLADFPLTGGHEERPVIDIMRQDKRKIPVGYSWARLNMPEGCDDCRVYTLQDLSRIREMENKIKQSEKMAAIGEIAAGIAHEFRNPLAAIAGAAQVLEQDADTDPGNLTLLKIILRESQRLESKISNFLQFSKPACPEPQWLSLSGEIAESQDILERGGRLPATCHLETEIPANLECWADPHQFRQVLINLIHNACLALDEEEGIITIRAAETEGKAGKTVTEIIVSDTGCGMDKKTAKQIFTPFFTTREAGTGLGLAIVQQIIEGHGGSITVSAKPGQGSTFCIEIPLPT